MKKIIIATAFLVLLAACQNQTKPEQAQSTNFPKADIKVSAKLHQNYNYSDKTYRWLDADIQVNDPSGKWLSPDFNYNRFIVDAIKRELKNKGIKEATKKAELVVHYGINLNMAAIKLKYYAGTDEPLVFKAPEGALSVIVADRESRRVLWTGWAHANYQKRSAEEARLRLDYMIQQIFKKFPK